MAGTATPLAPTPPTVDADLFRVGTASIHEKDAAKEAAGEMLPEQVPQPERKSGVEVRVLLAVPGGPLMTMPSARPHHVMFGALNDPKYRLRKPIPLEVTVEESNVVVSWTEIDEFGSGENLSAAIADFAQALRQLHLFLHQSRELGPDLANVKNVLHEYIEPRPR